MNQNNLMFNLIPPFSPLINIFLFTFFFLATRKAVAVDSHYLACSAPRTCGVHSISFPFFIEGKQQDSCGYPGFNITCLNNTTPILSLPHNDNLIIWEIVYRNQSLRVSNAAVFASETTTTPCIPQIRNVTIPRELFRLAEGQRELFLLHNCNLSSATDLLPYEINCSDRNETDSVLALFDDDPQLGYASKKCKNPVAAPVDAHEGEAAGGVAETLERGFVMKWIASNCSICEASGGRCGFDYATYHFTCFCPDRPHAWHCADDGDIELKLKLGLAVAISGIFTFIILALCFICFKRRFSKRPEDLQKIEAFIRANEFLAPKRYSYSDVKTMTKSFKEKLGHGGYGAVYKGTLLDGRDVAVKILKEPKANNGESFINEVASISRTSHVNIVTLMGFCFEGHKRALVYEFVPNGSLEKFIYQENLMKADRDRLSWETLYKIAVGIANGLEYLHRGCNTRILHFDIKPHNILLDDDFCPKICDFGLAKLCPGKQSNVTITGARGTAGYIAPEVFFRSFGAVSHKSDVYSYGMMILEMAGGRRNIDAEADRTSDIYFPHWIYKRLELDEELGLQGTGNELDQEKARKMILVGLWCIQTDPSDRPPMSRVVEMLEGSLEALQIPPKPFLSSPPRPQAHISSTSNPERQ